MFDEFAQQKSSRGARIIVRVGIALAAGTLLTFIIPSALGAIWPYFQDSHFQPRPFAVAVTKILNLPALLICRLFPPQVTFNSDRSMVCWAYGFFLNIPYYSLVIYIALWAGEKLLDRRNPSVIEST
jgi:hypothetical protein